jgi:hypothetical protein
MEWGSNSSKGLNLGRGRNEAVWENDRQVSKKKIKKYKKESPILIRLLIESSTPSQPEVLVVSRPEDSIWSACLSGCGNH